MNSTAGCPRAARIRVLLEGNLDPDGQLELAEHLDHCPACQAQFEQLASDFEFLPGIARGYSSLTGESDGLLRAMLEELGRNLAEEMTTADKSSSQDTVALGFRRPDAEEPLEELPEQIGPYKVMEMIGRGGMGLVLKARDPKLNRIVALKVLAPQLAANHVARARFLREARSAAAIRDDHVITIFAVDEADGFPFLVMEYLPGGSLAEHLERQGALPVEEVVRVGRQVALAIAAAHASGVIHRDLKPANILLDDGTRRIKIADFGLARAVHDAALTQTGCIGGTPPYMSPEQGRDEQIDHRSDLFSLGSVLYAMCTGQAPFRGTNPLGIIRQVCDEIPTPIRQLNPDCPQWLADIVDRLMAKDPDARWQSAQQVADLLESHLAQHHRARQLPLATTTLPGDTPVTHSLASAPAAQQPPPTRGLTYRLATIAAVMLLVGSAVVIVIKNRDGKDTTISAPDGSHVSIGNEGQVVVDLADTPAASDRSSAGEPLDLGLRELRHILAHNDAVNCVDISSSGDRLVSAAGDGAVRVWDAATGEMLHDLVGHRGPVLTVRFTSDGKFALSAGEDHAIRMWDVSTGRLERQFTGHTATVRVLEMAADNEHFFSGGQDAQIMRWQFTSAVPLNRLGYANYQPKPQPRELQDLNQLDGHVSWVRCLALSPEQQRLASGGNEALLAVWDIGDTKIVRRLIHHLAPVSSVAFSDDGRYLLSAGFDNEVCVWSVSTGEAIHVFEHPAPVLDLLVLPSSQYAVTACEDGVLRSFHLSSGKQIFAHTTHPGGVTSVALAPAGDTLVSAGHDKTIRIWKVPADLQE